MRKMKMFLIGLILCGTALSVTAENARPGEQSAKKRPNIVIIYVDDLALGDVGAFGCPDPGTPNIDTLAQDGVKLTRAYTTLSLIHI